MKKYLKRLSKFQMLLILIAVLAIGFYYFYLTESLPFQKADVVVQEAKTEEGKSVLQVQDATSEQAAEEFPFTMQESEVMSAIHKMSHQKVTATKKWGAIPLTPQRVERLLQVIAQNKAKYKNSQLYLNILNRWAKEDFSQADVEHNAIWKLQGGTVGKATGLSSTHEEKEFIEQNFNIKIER
jgi:capsular polysaccharide biosynthesis protein